MAQLLVVLALFNCFHFFSPVNDKLLLLLFYLFLFFHCTATIFGMLSFLNYSQALMLCHPFVKQLQNLGASFQVLRVVLLANSQYLTVKSLSITAINRAVHNGDFPLKLKPLVSGPHLELPLIRPTTLSKWLPAPSL